MINTWQNSIIGIGKGTGNGTCDLNFIWTNFTVNANKWKVTCSALSIQPPKKKRLNISKKAVSLNEFSRQVIFSKTTRPKPLTLQEFVSLFNISNAKVCT